MSGLGQRSFPCWLAAIVAASGLKVCAGLLVMGYELSRGGGADPRNLTLVANLLIFSAVALFLLLSSRGDRRADALGAVLFCAASTYASNALDLPVTQTAPWLHRLAAFMRPVNPDAFVPMLFWMFFREFPRVGVGEGAVSDAARSATRVAAIAGVLFFLFGGLYYLDLPALRGSSFAIGFPLAFWAVAGVLCLLALAHSLWRYRAAEVEERRRVQLFVAGVALGIGPVFGALVLGFLWPDFGRVLSDPDDRWGLSLLLLSLPMLVPVTAAYAVVVDQALELRLVLRQAIRYALARYTVLGASAVPFVLTGLHLYRMREQPLNTILSHGVVLPLLALSGFGVFLVLRRGQLLRSIDKRFFREQYDAYLILQEVVDSSRQVQSSRELALLLSDQVDRALHLERVSVLVLDVRGACFRSADHSARRLPIASPLVHLVAGSSEAMDVDLEDSASPLEALPEEDRQWLADGGFRLLVPLRGSAGDLVGLVALAEKRSELPFSNEDRRLLASAAGAAAAALERLLMASSGLGSFPGGSRSEEQPLASSELAGECVVCGALRPRVGGDCSECGHRLRPAALPLLAQGKYRLQRRLGSGGMGVVYLARDVELARDVAVKTLPRLSPERSLRMRREARAMAAITHPNVATIYSVEAWQGVPMLVLEYLSGRTLRERLQEGRLEPAAVVELGVALASALEAAHGSGVLHRDLKPSNVGFDRGGVPKLLDFGLARILAELGVLEEAEPDSEQAALISGLHSWTGADQVVGTPAYLSPEAALGQRPAPSFDLWGLAVVMLEALVGHNPLRGVTLEDTLLRVSAARVAPVRELRPSCPEGLAELLDRCLAVDPARRPPTARAMRRSLEELRSTH